MGLLTWILVGLAAGVLAEMVLGGGLAIGPRRLIMAILFGVAGAIVGGFISTRLGYGDVTGFNLRSVFIALGGAILVIFTVRTFSRATGA